MDEPFTEEDLLQLPPELQEQIVMGAQPGATMDTTYNPTTGGVTPLAPVLPPMAPLPTYTPTPIPRPGNVFQTILESGMVPKFYDSQLDQVNNQLSQATSSYMQEYNRAAPSVNYGAGQFFAEMLPLIVGGAMGQPSAGLQAADYINKQWQDNREFQLRAMQTNPMLRFLAEKQQNLQQVQASIMREKAQAQTDMQLKAIGQDQAIANADYRHGQAMETAGLRDRYADENAEASAKRHSEGQKDYFLFKQGEEQKLKGPIADQLLRYSSGANKYGQRVFELKDPLKIPQYAAEVSDLREFRKDAEDAVRAVSANKAALRFLDEVQKGKRDVSAFQLNDYLDQIKSTIQIYKKNEFNMGAALNDAEKKLLSASYSWPGDEISLSKFIFSESNLPTFQSLVRKMNIMDSDLRESMNMRASGYGGEINFDAFKGGYFYDNAPGKTENPNTGGKDLFSSAPSYGVR